jgi:hypothetical protein
VALALNDAVASGLIRVNPSTGVKRPTVKRREMSTWSAKDLHTFLASTEGDRLHPLWRLLSVMEDVAPRPRSGAFAALSLSAWRARQDSNLRPSD